MIHCLSLRRKCALLAGFIVAWTICFGITPSSANAAEWEWTKGKGWTEGAGKVRPSASSQFKYARSLEAKNEYYDASKQYFLLLKTYPYSDRAGFALQRLALCLFKMENYYETFKAVEQVLASYPNSAKKAELMGIEYTVGKKLMNGATVSILNDDPEANRYAGQRKAVEVFTAVLKNDKYGLYADDSLLALGKCYSKLGNTDKAIDAYDRLMREFPKSPLIDLARTGRTFARSLAGKASQAEITQIRDQAREQRKEARENKSKLSAEEIAFAKNVTDLEELEAKKMWKQADYYLQRGSYESVTAYRFLLREIIRRYPHTTHANLARERLPHIVIPKKDTSRFNRDRITLVPKFLRRKTVDKTKTFKVAEVTGAEELRSIPPDIDVPGMQDYTSGDTGGASAIPATAVRKMTMRLPSSRRGTDTSPANLNDRMADDSQEALGDDGVVSLGNEPAPASQPTTRPVERRAVESPPVADRVLPVEAPGTPVASAPPATSASASSAASPWQTAESQHQTAATAEPSEPLLSKNKAEPRLRERRKSQSPELRRPHATTTKNGWKLSSDFD